MNKYIEEFTEKYGSLITNINGEDMVDLQNLKTILHNEIVEGNMKALQMLKWVNEKFPNNKIN